MIPSVRTLLCAMAAAVASSGFSLAQESSPQDPQTVDPMQALAEYEPQSGTVKVGSVATIALSEGWLWLEGVHGRTFLERLGNMPGPQTLGVALPPDFLESNVFAVYSYADDGHVEDDEDPDYDELLESMQENAKAGSKERQKRGLQGVELLGWAEPPHYDKKEHKMFWAERLQFEGEEGETLNYNVRVLGRTGHMVVNGVGDTSQLDLVAKHNKELLRATEFVDGQRYSDFDPEYDKVAAYGIGGLIAGKLALKAGLFAKLGVLLLKFLKPILVGLAVVGGLLFKVFGGRKKGRQDEQVQPAVEE